MAFSEIDPRKRAELVRKAVPVAPLQTVVHEGFNIIQPFFDGSVKGVAVAQQWLDVKLTTGEVMRVNPGIKAEVVYWDGRDGIVAAFNPAGVQVGIGHATWNEDPRGRERDEKIMAYNTFYGVASEFTDQGLGFTMMQLLENHVALNTNGIGASFFYTVQAETDASRAAAFRMIEKIGAIESALPNYFTRIALKEHIGKRRPPQEGVTIVKGKPPRRISY